MDITSVSTSSLSHVNSQGGTKVASGKSDGGSQTMGGTTQADNINQQMARAAEKLTQRRVEQTKHLAESQELQQEQLEMLVDRLDEFVSTFNKGLSFRLDEDSGKSVVTVYEMSSGDIIRQIPEKEMLELAQQLSLHARGLVEETV